MALLAKFWASLRPSPAGGSDASVVMTPADEKPKASVVDGLDDSQPDHPGEDLQRGVQRVEAVTLAWSKASLIAVFFK
jgi:hypothetical protein